MTFTARLAAVTLLTAPFAAFGHARWTNPTPRSTRDNIKTSPPCGNPGDPTTGVRRANVTTFTAGATVQLNWLETVGHRGHFEIRFSPSQDQNFVYLPLAGGGMTDLINDPAGNQGAQSALVVMPSAPCNDCTLQLIQQMYSTLLDGGTTMSPYFSCADITLAGPPNDGGVGGQDAGSPPDAGSGSGGGGGSGGGTGGGGSGGGGGNEPPGGVDAGSTGTGGGGGGGGGSAAHDDSRIVGGCGSSATGSATLGGLLALVAGLGAIRRRRPL